MLMVRPATISKWLCSSDFVAGAADLGFATGGRACVLLLMTFTNFLLIFAIGLLAVGLPSAFAAYLGTMMALRYERKLLEKEDEK